jgi:ABC-type antimicrobial peptide transport system permease subunit
LGFSKIQVLLSLVLERSVIAAFGIITGSVVGYLLSRWVLNVLDTTASGRDIVPPVVFTADIGIIILTFICLIAAAVLAVALAVVSARRLRPSDILRTIE